MEDVFSIFIFFFELSPFFNFLPRSKTLMGAWHEKKNCLKKKNYFKQITYLYNAYLAITEEGMKVHILPGVEHKQ